jgi:biotin carboxylase
MMRAEAETLGRAGIDTTAGRERLIVVGSRLKAYREYALASLADRYAVALITSQPATWEQPHVSSVRVVDTTDQVALLAATRQLFDEAPGVPTGLLTWDELSLVAAAHAADHLGIPHLSPAAAATCRDKYATRSALDAAGIPAVRHRLVFTPEQAQEAAASLGLPVVLKPRSLAGSLGVVLASDTQAVAEAFHTASSASFAGLTQEPGVLVEEFLQGPEISIDSVVSDGVVQPLFLARKRLGFEPYFEEVGHLVGPWRHEPWADDVIDLLRQVHDAVGVRFGATHAEVRLTAAGPRLVELNGRIGGGLIPHLGKLACGVDLVLAAADVAMGRRPVVDVQRSDYAEIRFLYPHYDGVVQHLDTGDAAQVPGIAQVIELTEPGCTLTLPPQSLTPRTVALIATAADERGCRVALDRAEDQVSVSVLPSQPLSCLGAVAENAVTRRFLSTVQVVSGVRDVEWFRYGAGGGKALNRPVLLSEKDHDQLEADLNGMFELVTSLPDRLFGGDRRVFAAEVGMSATQTELVLRGSGRALVPMSRADMYREPSGFKLLELNTGSALGGWQMHEFTQAMQQSDRSFRQFMDEEDLVAAEPLAAIAEALRAEFADRELPSRPVLAITEWPDSFEKSKPWLDFVVPGWMRLGFDPVVCHLGEITYQDGVPWVRGRRIDIVYRIFLPGEIGDDQRSYDLVAPLLQASEDGKVQLFAGLDCELYGNKASLAMLSDERNSHAFTPAERDLINRVLPWTRHLREDKVQFGGETVDLIPYVLANKETLTLKPTLLCGGAGVVTGWTVEADEWTRQVQRALENGSYVVQARVLPMAERFRSEDGAELRAMVVAYGVMMVNSRYAGMLVRGVPDFNTGVVGMSYGAQIGCAFHVQPRPADPKRTP